MSVFSFGSYLKNYVVDLSHVTHGTFSYNLDIAVEGILCLEPELCHCCKLIDCIDILITPITFTVSLSLTEVPCPSHFKSALVSSLLKEPPLNNDCMKNYRPVSNLSFLSKVLGKVVVSQLNSHINNSNTSNNYQSAYKTFHSIKPALKLRYDILASVDFGKVHCSDFAGPFCCI